MPRRRPTKRAHWAAWTAAVALATGTGLIHASIAVDFLGAGLTRSGMAFLAMAAGYAVGVMLLLWRGVEPLVLGLGILYVVGLLGAWAIVGARDALALFDKVLEVALLGLLVGLLLAQRQPERHATGDERRPDARPQ